VAGDPAVMGSWGDARLERLATRWGSPGTWIAPRRAFGTRVSVPVKGPEVT